MKVKHILAIKGSFIYSISPVQTINDAVVSMAEKNIGSLVCLDNDKFVGMLTFREVLLAVRQDATGWGRVKVADAMMKDAPTADLEMSVDELRRLMLDSHVRYLPVVDNNKLVGVLSFHDIAKAVLEAQSFENKMLMAYIHDTPQVQSPS